MAQRVYVVLDGKGKPLGFGTRLEAVAAAQDEAAKTGGIAVVQEPDPRDVDKVRNPVEPEKQPEAAYKMSGLPEICMAKYGQYNLDINLVEALSLQEALDLVRPHLPQSAKYSKISDDLLGGQSANLQDENLNQFGMLGRNAKLAKGDSPDGRMALAFGLSLAPHQAGLRLTGKATPHGWEPPADFGEKKFGDKLFDSKYRDVSGELYELSEAKLGERGAYTTCYLSTSDCRASCLVHSGQNAASIEALTAKLCLTRALYAEPAAFCRLLLENLRRYFTWGGCGDFDLFVRLNVFSDIPWELFFPDLIDPFKKVAMRAPDGNKDSKYPPPVWDGKKWQNKDAYLQRPQTGHGSFYDYTKVPARMEVFAHLLSMVHKTKKTDVLQAAKSFYHLTFSFSGNNEADSVWHLERGDKVAVVFVLERLEKYGGEQVRRGAKTVGVTPDTTRRTLRLPRDTPTKTITVLGQLLKYADSGTYSKDSDLGRFLKANGLALPADPHPREREFWAAETASHLGFRFAPNDFRLPVSPDSEGNLRGDFEGDWFYGFEFKQPSCVAGQEHSWNKHNKCIHCGKDKVPFAGYPILNADRNDLRAKDGLILHKTFGKDSGAIVGLDFKVAKIRIALDEYAVVKRLGGKKLQYYDASGEPVSSKYQAALWPTQREAEDAIRAGRFPRDVIVRREGELAQVKLDLEKNRFVTPVYKEGDVFYVAQTPPQTMDGSQEHG